MSSAAGAGQRRRHKMEQTTHPAEALEHAVEDVFNQITSVLTVEELRERISAAISAVAWDLDTEKAYINTQLPGFLDSVLGSNGKNRVEDPDYIKTEAVSSAELHFRKIYNGKA